MNNDRACIGATPFELGYTSQLWRSCRHAIRNKELRVYLDGEEYVVDNTLPFISDAFYGSLDEPYVLEPLIAIKKGDANGDGTIDIADAVCVVNHILGKPKLRFFKAAADVNNDGAVDIADALTLVDLLVGRE